LVIYIESNYADQKKYPPTKIFATFTPYAQRCWPGSGSASARASAPGTGGDIRDDDGVVLSFDELLEVVLPHAIGVNSDLHGLEHWRRVHDVGLELAAQTPDADPQVVAAFSVFHDALRVSDGVDPEHGVRGSRLANALVTWLDRDQLRKLLLACSDAH